MESDPTGLKGGLNTYSYVATNPLRWIDSLGLYFSVSPSAAAYVAALRANSPTASKIMDAMAADTSTYYHVDAGPVPASSGGGETHVQQPTPSLWDDLMNKPLPPATVQMIVDPNAKVYFTDTCGKSFKPSTDRILGHELGHGYTYLKGKFIGYHQNYDQAIDIENQIAKELDPNAPTRAVSDHGDDGLQ